MTIRPAVSTDRDFLFDLHSETMRPVIEQTWGWDEAWQRADFERRLASYNASVVEAGGQPIGGLFLEHGDTSIYIHEIQLLPAWQGRGIGTEVIQGVINDATRRGVAVTLSVLPANPRAQRLYERLGFEVVSIDEPFIRMRRDAATPRG